MMGRPLFRYSLDKNILYKDELFLRQEVNFQARPVLGRVHDGDVHKSSCHMRDQILRDVDMNTKRYIGM